MQSIQENMNRFRKELKAGAIQKAYKALIDYILDLRAHFKNRYSRYSISGLYQGYMDMTYFAIVPPSLKDRDLKIAIVFNYETFKFEAWLSGTNREVQRKYWELIRDSQWTEYRVVTPAKGVDSIIECDLSKSFDFGDLDKITESIEANTVAFIDNIERFLSDHESM